MTLTKEDFLDNLDSIREHISLGCAPNYEFAYLEKGIIIEDDKALSNLTLAKVQLGFDELKSDGKAIEINIDETWTKYMINSAANEDGRMFWNKLVFAAQEVRRGLLIINISNIKAFKHCWKLKQLAKQELPLELWPGPKDDFYSEETMFRFHGYVLLILNGFSIRDAKSYAEENLNGSEFHALRSYYDCFKG